MKKFKALITFAANEKMYYPFDEEPREAPEELVNAWAEAGYVEIIEEKKAKIKKADK